MVRRDVELAELTGGRVHLAHLSCAAVVRRAARRQAPRPRGHAARPARTTGCSPTRRSADYDTARQDEPAAALGARSRRRASRRSPTARSTASSPTTRRTRARRSASRSTTAPFGIVGLETALGAHAHRAGAARATSRSSARSSCGPTRRGACSACPQVRSSAGSPADLVLIDPDGRVDGGSRTRSTRRAATRRSRAGASPAACSPPSATARSRTRPSVRSTERQPRHVAARCAVIASACHPGARRRPRVPRRVVRRRVETTGEVVFNTAMTGYQEVAARSVLLRADRHLHLSRCSATTASTTRTWRATALRAQGMVCRDVCERPSNWRSTGTARRRCSTEQRRARHLPASTRARSPGTCATAA